MDIFESPCIETRRLENMNSVALQNLHGLHLVSDFLNFFGWKSNIFLNLHVLYTEIFTLKAYNSAKKQQMTEIF